jgi:5-formyltetrahydrofolate cyclo-ligase
LTLKTKWREILLQKRKSLSKARREEAALLLKETFQRKGNVLSFTPIGSEIDVGLLNEILAKESRLFLVPYRLDTLLDVPLSKIDCILVPALGFDRKMYRLGYGKGYYDRLLSMSKDIWTVGVGFKEQLCEELLPIDPWDVPVKELMLI